jgi:hypothetical protein
LGMVKQESKRLVYLVESEEIGKGY